MVIVNCQIRGQVSQDFSVLDEKPPDGYTWSGERLTRKQTTFTPDTLWPEIWKNMSDASKRKEKQKWAIEKPKLDNARRLRGIYFIDPADEEFKNIMKNARGKLEVPMPAQCLARFNVRCTGKLLSLKRIARQNTLPLLTPTNLHENAWKGLKTRTTKTTWQEEV